MHSSLSTRDLALAALFAALISVGALVSIPVFGPVPLTLQVLFVLLAGLVLGARLGALSVVAYIVGSLAQRSKAQTLWPLLGIALVGLVPIYAIGASWLAWQLHTTGFETVVWGGIMQFIPGDVAKAVAAALTARALVSLPLGLPVLSRPR